LISPRTVEFYINKTATVWSYMQIAVEICERTFKKFEVSWTPVVHTCNPSYSGGRDQEDHSSKPAGANRSRDPITKNPSQK
jgi:hypothetical protein